MEYRSTGAHKNERIAYALWPLGAAGGGGGAGARVPTSRSGRLLPGRPALTTTRTRVNYTHKVDIGK
jgi:hypothetical protein